MKPEPSISMVVVGCSAGGFEALQQILPHLSASMPFSVCVVIHLPADSTGSIAELFADRCAVHVKEAEDKELINPGFVYFAPPGYHLLVEPNESFSLSVENPVHYSRPSIDVLFETASVVYGNRLAGIVLSGNNQDGAEGLAALIDNGGIGIVQDPRSAGHPIMPKAASIQAKPHYSLNLQGIRHWLVQLTEGGGKCSR